MTAELKTRDMETFQTESPQGKKRYAKAFVGIRKKVASGFSKFMGFITCRGDTFVNIEEAEEGREEELEPRNDRIYLLPDPKSEEIRIKEQITPSVVKDVCDEVEVASPAAETIKTLPSPTEPIQVSSPAADEIIPVKEEKAPVPDTIKASEPVVEEKKKKVTFSDDSPIIAEEKKVEEVISAKVEPAPYSKAVKNNEAVLEHVVKFISTIESIVNHASPMKDASYAPVLLLFYLKQENYKISRDLQLAEVAFHAVDTAPEEDVHSDVATYLVADGLEPTICINYWMAYKVDLENSYSSLYKAVVSTLLEPNKANTRSEKTLVFYKEVLMCVRNIVSYALAEMHEERDADFVEDTMFTELVEKLMRGPHVKEYLKIRHPNRVIEPVIRPENTVKPQVIVESVLEDEIVKYTGPNPENKDSSMADLEKKEPSEVLSNTTQKSEEVEESKDVPTPTSEQPLPANSSVENACTPSTPALVLHPQESMLEEAVGEFEKNENATITEFKLAEEPTTSLEESNEEETQSTADPLINDLEASPLFLKQKSKHNLLS
ncbi:hypothetical protein NEAUS03_0852 [Nematocida ausubeli]|nr:hypothetical protein NEAUS03_0852 [Nematocida ausubeli]